VGDVIEPWMFPAITPLIRDTIKRRYELIPYLYSSAIESHRDAIPPQRWVGWGYESDPEVWTPALLKGEAQYWLGDTLLIGGVYESGLSTARMYLPRAQTRVTSSGKASIADSFTNPEAEPREGYINLNAPYQHLLAGQWVTIESAWQNSIPVLAKIGGAIPVGKPAATSSPLEDKTEFPSLVADDYRGIEIFPPKGSSNGHIWKNTWYEDDGLSAKPNISNFTISYTSTAANVMVTFEKNIHEIDGFVPLWKELEIILPVFDERVVTGADGRSATDLGRDSRGRRVFKISVA
jgi:alpha-glucosidase (family GH31 glycosyl hydrolase)